jgi:hypothetical protein
MKDLFVDQLVNVTVFQGVARLEFARIESVDTETNQAKMSQSYRVCMTLAAFTNLAEQVAKAQSGLAQQANNESSKKMDD